MVEVCEASAAIRQENNRHSYYRRQEKVDAVSERAEQEWPPLKLLLDCILCDDDVEKLVLGEVFTVNLYQLFHLNLLWRRL